MRVVHLALLAALLASGCKYNLDGQDMGDGGSGRPCKVTTAAVCQEATTHSDFAWIESKIFLSNCFGASCHTGVTASGKLDLSGGKSYASLLGAGGTGGVKSTIDTSRDLVVPTDPNKSYLYLMLHAIDPSEADPPASAPPSNVGYMPMNNGVLCCQKLDAVQRWIQAGAMND